MYLKIIFLLILICSQSSQAQVTPTNTESDHCHDYKVLFIEGISMAMMVKIVQSPIFLEILGFGELGILKDSFASKFQSFIYEGETPSGSIFSILQSITMKKQRQAFNSFIRYSAIAFQAYLAYDLLYCYGDYQESLGQPNHLKQFKTQIYDLIQSNEYTKQTHEQINQLLEQTSQLYQDSINKILNNEKVQYVNEKVTQFVQQQSKTIEATFNSVIKNPIVSETLKAAKFASKVIEEQIQRQAEETQAQLNYLTDIGSKAANTAFQAGQEYIQQIKDIEYADKLEQTKNILQSNGQALIEQATNTIEDIASQTKNHISDTIQKIDIQAINQYTTDSLKEKYEWIKTFL